MAFYYHVLCIHIYYLQRVQVAFVQNHLHRRCSFFFCTVNFRMRPQGSQLGPALAEADTAQNSYRMSNSRKLPLFKEVEFVHKSPVLSLILRHINSDHIFYPYIYIYTFPPVVLRPNMGYDLLILDVSRSHTTTHHNR